MISDKRIFQIFLSDEGICTFTKVVPSFPVEVSWAKLISDKFQLPLPSSILYPNQIPGRVLLEEKYTLDPSEIIIEAYMKKTFKCRGVKIYPWRYRISGVDSSGNFFSFSDGWMDLKKQMRRQGMDKQLLEGTKTLAALIRIAHANRLDMILE